MVTLGMMIHGTMTISSKKDYLSILGLSHDFDDKELKKAFRREARKWHPDLNNYQDPATSPDEPPPIKLYQDIETIIELTPDEALIGASILIELEDETVVEVDTPPFAGDGWRLRLENIARGGKDHYLQLKVQTESGLRIDGLRVLYKLELFPHDALLGLSLIHI